MYKPRKASKKAQTQTPPRPGLGHGGLIVPGHHQQPPQPLPQHPQHHHQGIPPQDSLFLGSNQCLVPSPLNVNGNCQLQQSFPMQGNHTLSYHPIPVQLQPGQQLVSILPEAVSSTILQRSSCSNTNQIMVEPSVQPPPKRRAKNTKSENCCKCNCKRGSCCSSTIDILTKALCSSHAFYPKTKKFIQSQLDDKRRRFTCGWPGCGWKFARLDNLQRHERIHKGEKPFKCSWQGCGWTFSQPSTLKTHERTHTGEKPYLCSSMGCGKRFSRLDYLNKHYRIHLDEKPFNCPHCGLKFRQQSHLDTHVKVHTGEKPFKCNWPNCNVGYSRATSLQRHKLAHNHHLSV